MKHGQQPAFPLNRHEAMTNNKIKVGRENTADIELYYQDLGSGKAVILIHA